MSMVSAEKIQYLQIQPLSVSPDFVKINPDDRKR